MRRIVIIFALLVMGQRVQEHTGWEDLRFSANAVSLAGSDVPTWVNCYDGIYCLSFDDIGNDDEVTIYAQFPHRYMFESDIIPHIHWGLEDATDCDVVWCMEYDWTEIGDTFGVSTTDCITVNSESTTMKHVMDNFTTISGTDYKTLSSVMAIRVYRDGDAGGDTCNAKEAYFWEFDIHYQHDSMGSTTVTTK